MSSAEAELIALCACVANVAYCRKLELGFLQVRPTIIHEGHVGAKQLAESGIFQRTLKAFLTSLAASSSLHHSGHKHQSDQTRSVTR
jgi:hypothetical protein